MNHTNEKTLRTTNNNTAAQHSSSIRANSCKATQTMTAFPNEEDEGRLWGATSATEPSSSRLREDNGLCGGRESAIVRGPIRQRLPHHRHRHPPGRVSPARDRRFCPGIKTFESMMRVGFRGWRVDAVFGRFVVPFEIVGGDMSRWKFYN